MTRGKARVPVGEGTEPWHGTVSGFTYHSCGCRRCVSAQNARQKKYRDRYKAERLAGPVPEHVHGMSTGYGRWGCRCEKCSTAKSAADKNCRARTRKPKTKPLTTRITSIASIRPVGMTLDRAMEIAIAADLATLNPVVANPELNEQIKSLNSFGLNDSIIADRLDLSVDIVARRRRGMGLPVRTNQGATTNSIREPAIA